MTQLIVLDDRTLVAGQIGPDDVERAAAAGVTRIVNNRPDGEEPGQPAGAALAAAAVSAGLAYHHIPFQGLPDPAAVDAIAALLAEADGRTLLFCRSGTRSTWGWALARARLGEDPAALISAAAGAGYDLRALPAYLG